MFGQRQNRTLMITLMGIIIGNFVLQILLHNEFEVVRLREEFIDLVNIMSFKEIGQQESIKYSQHS